VRNVSYDAEPFLRLSINEVATSDGHRSALNEDSRFEAVLDRIYVSIKNCGNSVDTYYKQSRVGE
jgi:hypothetical protein